MLGQGIYPLSEVARYTRVPLSTLRSWFVPRSDERGLGPIFASDWDRVDEDYAISFVNLIEAHVASHFRNKGIKPRDIRKVHEILREGWGIAHPFASEDLRMDAEAKRIIMNRAGDQALIDVLHKQMVLETARPYLQRIEYGAASRLAERWHIAEGVVINPKVGFGKPVIDNTGVSTLIVANQYLANGRDAALVARLFKIAPAGVLSAVEFERSIKRIAA